MPQSLEFYDIRSKEKFFTSNYKIFITSKGMLAARAIGPSGVTTIKILHKA